MTTEQQIAIALERVTANVAALLVYITDNPPVMERSYHTESWQVKPHTRKRNGKQFDVRGFEAKRHALTSRV